MHCAAPQETSPNGEFAGEVSHLAVLVARLVELPVAFRSPAVDVSETVSVSSGVQTVRVRGQADPTPGIDLASWEASPPGAACLSREMRAGLTIRQLC